MTPETITLPDNLSIRSISAVCEDLLAVFERSDAVVLDIPGNASADLSFIQLVESARQYARSSNKFITLKKPAPTGVVDTLRRGGFLTNMDEATRLFWLHGKEIQ